VGNPFTPDPTTPKGHGKYVERAQFLGDTSRRIRAEQDPEEFRSLLEGKVNKEKRVSDPLQPEDMEALEGAARPAAGALGATSDLRQEATQLEARREESGREEAEKRLGAWHGPSAFAGLPAAASLGLLNAAQIQHGERSRGGNRASIRIEIPPGEARVDPELVQGLLEAGLRRPISGLEDPRLASAPPQLPAGEGWRTSPTGKGVAIHWEAPGRNAYQRLEWSEATLILETAAGSKLQALERQGGQIFVRHSSREAPPAFPA